MLDEDTGMFYIGSKMISLTFFENIVLGYLIDHKYKICTYKDMLRDIYLEKNVTKIGISRLAVIICRLRKKLNGYVNIRRIRNVGFIIEVR